jgi:hypothetical protein
MPCGLREGPGGSNHTLCAGRGTATSSFTPSTLKNDHHSYRVDRIAGARVANHSFVPRYEVELGPQGPVRVAPAVARSTSGIRKIAKQICGRADLRLSIPALSEDAQARASERLSQCAQERAGRPVRRAYQLSRRDAVSWQAAPTRSARVSTRSPSHKGRAHVRQAPRHNAATSYFGGASLRNTILNNQPCFPLRHRYGGTRTGCGNGCFQTRRYRHAIRRCICVAGRQSVR